MKLFFIKKLKRINMIRVTAKACSNASVNRYEGDFTLVEIDILDEIPNDFVPPKYQMIVIVDASRKMAGRKEEIKNDVKYLAGFAYMHKLKFEFKTVSGEAVTIRKITDDFDLTDEDNYYYTREALRLELLYVENHMHKIIVIITDHYDTILEEHTSWKCFTIAYTIYKHKQISEPRPALQYITTSMDEGSLPLGLHANSVLETIELMLVSKVAYIRLGVKQTIIGTNAQSFCKKNMKYIVIAYTLLNTIHYQYYDITKEQLVYAKCKISSIIDEKSLRQVYYAMEMRNICYKGQYKPIYAWEDPEAAPYIRGILSRQANYTRQCYTNTYLCELANDILALLMYYNGDHSI